MKLQSFSSDVVQPRTEAASRHAIKLVPKVPSTKYLFLIPAGLFALLFLLYPVLYSFVLSFRQATVDTFVSGEMPFNGFTQYDQLLHDPTFWNALGNTVIFTICSLVGQIMIGFFLALLFQFNFPFKNALLALLLVPWVIPLIASASIFRAVFDEQGICNELLRYFGADARPWFSEPHHALAAVTIANIWVGFPFSFMLLYAGMRSITKELYEAAKLDGSSYWQSVRHITVPVMQPVIYAILALGTVYTVKVFDLVWIMTGGGPAHGSHLLATYAYETGFSLLNFGTAAAVGIVAILLIVLLNLMQWLLRRGQLETN
jgi:multiple sugar transport system permease protein